MVKRLVNVLIKMELFYELYKPFAFIKPYHFKPIENYLKIHYVYFNNFNILFKTVEQTFHNPDFFESYFQ